MPPVGPNGSQPKPYRRWLGVVVALVLSMLVAVVLLTLEPLEPLPASAPTNEFSAERAFYQVDRIAQRPHPVGSAANTEVREYLVGQLEDLGLRPTVQATTAVQTIPDGTASLARVNNIHARIEGTDPTGHVVIVAHLDSVPNSPGASDDGAGVAAILEIARALTSGSSPRNDVDIVLTDAEEPGLLGAQAFVDTGTLDPHRSVVLNLEARGTSGPTLMFETNPDNANVIPALASARRPIAGSESAELYRLLPNDTDFTVFSRAGFAGMNFAFVEGSAHYHAPGDSPSNLDPSSLQHMGATVLDVVRHLARQDLGAPRGGPLTYFSALGQLVYYPQGLAVPLAVLAAVAFAATVLCARRRGLLARAVAVAAVRFLALLVVTGGIGVGARQALLLLHPGYGSFLARDTYRPEWYAAGLLALTAAPAVAWYLLMRRRSKPEEVAVAIWAWLVVFALITAVFVPGAAYMFTWTALVGCCALAAAMRWGGADPTWRQLACCAAAVPAILAFLPLVDFSTGLASAAFPTSIAVLVLVIALPVLDLLAPRRAWLVPVVVSVVGLALFATGLHIDAFDTQHPRQTSLVYALDADQEQASWFSADLAPAPWTARYANTEHSDADDRFPANGIFSLPSRYHAGPASVAQLAPPDVTVARSERDGDTRDLELRVAPAGATRLALYADTGAHTLEHATVDELDVDVAGGQPQGTEPSKWGFVFHAVPPEGIDVTLRVRGEGLLPLRVVTYRDGLSQVPELTPLPDDLRWSAASSNLTMTAKTYRV